MMWVFGIASFFACWRARKAGGINFKREVFWTIVQVFGFVGMITTAPGPW